MNFSLLHDDAEEIFPGLECEPATIEAHGVLLRSRRKCRPTSRYAGIRLDELSNSFRAAQGTAREKHPSRSHHPRRGGFRRAYRDQAGSKRSEEHTSELQ